MKQQAKTNAVHFEEVIDEIVTLNNDTKNNTIKYFKYYTCNYTYVYYTMMYVLSFKLVDTNEMT